MTNSAFTYRKPWSGQWLLYLGLLALEVFAWLPNSYTEMLDWYWIGVWQAGFLAIGLWFLMSLRQYQQPWQTLGYGLDWGVAALGLSLILSTLGADSPRAAGWYLVMALGHGILLYGVRNWLGGGLSGDRLWGLLCVSGGIAGLVSFGLWLPQADWLGLRNDFPLGQYQFVGGYLVLMLPLMITYAIAHQGWQRILAGLGSALLLLDLYTTAARSALVAIAIVGLLSYGLYLWGLRRNFSWQKLGLSSLILLGTLLTAGFNPRVLATAKLETVDPDLATQLNLIDSIQERFFLWAMSLDILQARPLNGLGMGNFGRQLDEFRSILGNIPETPQILSTPLQILCELGLYGAIASLLLLFMVMRLWLSMLPYLEENSEAEWLLYGIGASWLGYAIASFTDYHLENLAISTTLILSLALLLGVANEFSPDTDAVKTPKERRGIQLVSLSMLTFSLYLGLPLTLATSLNHEAQIAKERNQLETYEQKLMEAQKLVPWQPSYAVDVGMNYWQQRQDLLGSDKLPVGEYEALSGAISNAFLWAKNASPKDLLLQYNYAAIAFEFEPEKTTAILEKIIREQPNAFPYSHYLLAKSYLRLNEPREKIIQLLALQVLKEPSFFTLPLWESDESLAALKDEVYQTAIAHYQTLLDKLSSTNPDFNEVYTQMITLQWWQQDSLEQAQTNQLSPTMQALILTASKPERALEIINQALTNEPENTAFKILKTWLDPDYSITLNRPNTEPLTLSKPQQDFQNLQTWLKQIFPSELVAAIAIEGKEDRYRNPSFAGLSAVIPPGNLRVLPIFKTLNLLQNPSPMTERDKLILQIQQTELNNLQPDT